MPNEFSAACSAVPSAMRWATRWSSRPAAEIQERYGGDGIRHPEFNRAGEAEVSDDTQMTLFTADGLLQSLSRAGRVDQSGMLDAVREATLAWHALQTDGHLPGNMGHGLGRYATLLAKSQAPGTTCLGACAAGATGTPEDPINHSKGCGGVMRVAPVGLIPGLTPTRAFDLAARCAAQTHGHPSGYLSAGVLAALSAVSAVDWTSTLHSPMRWALPGAGPGATRRLRRSDMPRRWRRRTAATTTKPSFNSAKVGLARRRSPSGCTRRWLPRISAKPSASPATTVATATPRRRSRGRSMVPGKGSRAFRTRGLDASMRSTHSSMSQGGSSGWGSQERIDRSVAVLGAESPDVIAL